VLSFFSCELFDKENISESQSAMIYIQHYYTGRRAPDWNRIFVPSIYVSGYILGDPFPQINYVQVGEKQFSGPSYFEPLVEGEIYFSTDTRIWEDSIPEPKFNPINVKISTDIGQISGSITVPDTLNTLSVSVHDTVELGTPVTISWSGGNADFYYVYWEHSWMEVYGLDWFWLMYSRDTVIQGNSVTLSGSKFTLDGFIESIEVYPENGPFPEPGTVANLEGDGFGYMYVESKSTTTDVRVVFGDGIPEEWLMKQVASENLRNEFTPNPKAKILTQLGL